MRFTGNWQSGKDFWLRHLLVVLMVVGYMAPADASAGEFGEKVRPIISDRCFACHGPDIQKSGLRLDSRQRFLKGSKNGPVFNVDVIAESEILKRIQSTDPDYMMPPPEVKKPLSPGQRQVLTEWILGGAEYESHWAFEPLGNPVIPEASEWVRNPLDAFIEARHRKVGIEPSDEADRWVLGRRLAIDLTGLLPEYSDLAAFVEDPSEHGYVRYVNQLIDSDGYGERWARDWLDLARYADTNGYEKDRNRSIWPYRDWVVNAFNNNMPFDRFSLVQLAGDMLASPSQADLIATGFHRNTMTNEEGGIDVEEFRFHSIVDRVKTTGATWMGMTLSCAQCHTHKYDPVTQEEYFKVFAIFNNADEPDLEILSSEEFARKNQIERQIEQLLVDRKNHYPTGISGAGIKVQPIGVDVVEVESKNSSQIILNEGSGNVEVREIGADKDIYRIRVKLESGVKYVGIELNVLTADFLPSMGPGYSTSGGNFVLSNFSVNELDDSGDGTREIPIVRAEADFSQDGYPVANAIDNDNNSGWAIWDTKGKTNTSRSAQFFFASPVTIESDQHYIIELAQLAGGNHLIGHFNVRGLRMDSDTDEQEMPDPLEKFGVDFTEWLEDESSRAVKWELMEPVEMESERHASLRLQPDLSILAAGNKPNKDVYTIVVEPGAGNWTGMRLEVMPDPTLPFGGPGRAHFFQDGDFFLSEVRVSRLNGTDVMGVKLVNPSASREKGGRPIANTLDGKRDTGWQVGNKTAEYNQAVFPFKEAVALSDGDKLEVVLDQHFIHQVTLGKFRLALTQESEIPLKASRINHEASQILFSKRLGNKLAPDSVGVLENQFLALSPAMESYNGRVRKLRESLLPRVTSLVMEERQGEEKRVTYFRDRGEFLKPERPVGAGVPEVLRWDKRIKEPKDRLEFARWLFHPDHPLTARVFVNRTWARFFGKGLVPTLDDFGLQGASPSHPELLDWLARDFQLSGWNVKRLHRMIVTSSTYRQSSERRTDVHWTDPTNQYYHRSERIRLDAEMIRDTSLQAAGILSRKSGGPGVFPPQDTTVTKVAYGSPSYQASKGDDRYRRGIYTFWKRTQPYASFMVFDAPSGDMVCVRRERSNTPLQSLVLLNDPVYVEAATKLAQRLLSHHLENLDDLIHEAYLKALNRQPEASELSSMRESIESMERLVAGGELAGIKPPADLEIQVGKAKWTAVFSLCRAILNSDEMVVRP